MEHNQYARNPTFDHPIYCIITTMGMIDSAHITSKENHSSRKVKSDLLLPASRRVTNEMSNLLRIKHYVNDHPDKLQELWEQQWISNDVNIGRALLK
ncbi:628_t:CDS:2, partial [Funneliformis caledonium]